MQAGSRKAHGKATFDAMCLVVEVLQQAENSGGLDLAVSPDPEEPDLQISEDVPSVVVTALLCLGGECGYRLSHANSTLWLQSGLQGADAAWRIMPASQEQTFAICVSVRGRTSFYLTSMVWFPWRSIRAISALRSGMLRSTWMATQFLAIREVYGCISVTPAAGCFCKRPT